MLGLAIVVGQIARHRAEALYPTTLAVRVVIVAALYATSRDPPFLVLAAIVGLGMLFTLAGLLTDRSGRAGEAGRP